MFENFKKITIKGGYFEDETELELFKEDAISIVYGRNGSGKSTIACCLKQLSESEEEQAIRKDEVAQGKETGYIVGSDLAIGAEYKSNIFVFNEDFVQNNVKVGNDGLNTIVMLGEQIEIDKEINTKRGELDKIIELIKSHKCKNAEGERELRRYKDDIMKKLREDGGWAERDQKLRGNKKKSSVSDALIDELLKIDEPRGACEQLRTDVCSGLELCQKSKNSQAIEWTTGELRLPENLEVLAVLLETDLAKPQLTEREEKLMELLSKMSQRQPHFEQDHTRQMLKEGWTFCTLCLREITEKDQQLINKTLGHIINDNASKFINKLDSALNTFDYVTDAVPVFPDHLNKTELDAAIVARENLNKTLEAVREKIEERRRNVYESLKNPFNDEVEKAYIEARTAWRSSLTNLNECVEEFNTSIITHEKLIGQLSSKNKLLARKELADLVSSYKNALEKESKGKEELKELEKQQEYLNGHIKSLEIKKRHTGMALEYINNELRYIFYDNRSINLMAGDGCYKLTVNSREVKPRKISVGERNALGLCYFFATIFGEKEIEKIYNHEYLVIIDDPISSFDYGNRLGVMSLLRHQFSNIINGNKNSRILVMTHDLQSVFDLAKITNDLLPRNKNRGKFKFLEIKNKAIKEEDIKSEYMKLLTSVYKFASSPQLGNLDEIMTISIGNIMRRTLEAFSTFCYNASFVAMMHRDEILNNVPVNKKEYYKNFMFRLALNGESHEEERVYTLTNMTPVFDRTEKQRTARILLRLLLYINENHIRSYIDESMVNEIINWGV